MGNLCSSGKLYKWDVIIIYIKYTWIANYTNWFVPAFPQANLDVDVFMEILLEMGVSGNRR